MTSSIQIMIIIMAVLIMSGRDLLYRSVLRGTQESPQLQTSVDMSPMSSLAFNLQNLSHATPKRRLSLSSNMTDTPGSIHDGSLLFSSFLNASSEANFGASGCEDQQIPHKNEKSPSRRLPSRDKENFQSPYFSPSHSRSTKPARPQSSPLKDVQNTCNRNLSFSPFKKTVSPSKRQSNTPHKPSPPEDFDTNSQDSGYSESGKKVDDECFSVPVTCAPRKLNLDLSPPKSQIALSPPKAISSSTPVSRSSSRSFSSLSKCDDEDTILMDLMNEVGSVEDIQPSGFSTLLSAPIHVTKKSPVKPLIQRRGSLFSSQRLPIRRCLSMMDNTTPTSSRTTSVIDSNTPTSSKVEYEKSPVKNASSEITSFKRPAPPSNLNCMVEAKRRKSEASPFQTGTTTIQTTLSNISNIPLIKRQISVPSPTNGPKHKLFRSNSESQVSIMKALSKSANVTEKLTGDLSRPIALPTIPFGKHPDLPSISHDTLADLIEGRYKDAINSYTIIDCRYPYEFEGGHIKEAASWHNPQMVLDHLAEKKVTPVIPGEGVKRDILIFHCEFSAERGPKAQRLLREKDRTASTNYPALNFPELYLLEGGYRVFYQQYPEFCTPEGYTMMLDAKFEDDFKHFRAKSKSWASDNKQTKSRGLPRTGLKRLGL
ncbi:unnamed protein product, partial [Meganyctiphanes norvegica]